MARRPALAVPAACRLDTLHINLRARVPALPHRHCRTEGLLYLCSDSPDNPLPHTAWHSGLSLEKGLAASWLRSVAGARGSGGGGVVCCSAIWSVRECSDAVNPGCPLGLIAFRAGAFPPLGPVGQVTQCQVLSLFPSMVLLFIISVSAAQVLGTSTAPAPRQSLGSLG